MTSSLSFLKNDSLFYVSSSSGTENILLLTPGNKLTAVTHSRFGAIDASVTSSSVIFADYSASGNNICTMSLSEITGEPYTIIKPVSYLVEPDQSG